MYERILVPLDGSELSEHVLPYATEMARNCGSEIVLLQAVRPFADILGDFTAGATALVVAPSAAVGADLNVAPVASIVTESTAESARQQHEGMVAQARAYLTEQASPLAKAAIRSRTEVVEGTPADVILGYARANEIGLIAMSTHGRGGLGRLVFGSVADAVVRNSHLPVLLIPPRG